MNKNAGTDWGSVAKMLGGGAMLGAGAGAAVTFLKHLRELHESAHRPGDDPSVLYVDLPAPVNKLTRGTKTASANPNSNTATTFALSALAGLVGSALAYTAVRDVYSRRRKREVNNELAQAQHVYMGGLNESKSASQYSIPSKLIGTGYLGFLLTALGSAVVAKKMLDKRFPPVHSPSEVQPRKIVIRHVDPTTHKPLDDGESMPGSVSPNAVEGLVRTQMSDPKMASNSDIANLVKAAAAGRCEEIRNLIVSAGVDGMFDTIKGASDVTTDAVANNLAITWVCNDPLVSSSVAPVIAAEFFKNASWTFDLLPQLDKLGLKEASLVGLVESAAVLAREHALRPVLEKTASAKSAEEMHGISPMKTLFFAGALKTILDDPKRNEASEHQDMNVAEGVETIGTKQPKSKNRVDLEISDDLANQFARRYAPAIDKTLARQV